VLATVRHAVVANSYFGLCRSATPMSFGNAFDAVIPSMPGYGVFGQADNERLGTRAYRTCLDSTDEAPWMHALCGKAAIGVRLSLV
jgi:hypothetical protein